MSRERQIAGAGETSGPRADDGRFGGCLTDGALQAAADGTLRGPELFLARQHIDECPRCSAELVVYQGLLQQLSALQPPAVPPEFTSAVIATIELRERTRDEKHRALLAALPAALIALAVLFVWAFSGNTGARIRDLVVGATVLQRVAEAVLSVLRVARLPIGISALLCTAAVFAMLARQVAGLRAAGAVRS